MMYAERSSSPDAVRVSLLPASSPEAENTMPVSSASEVLSSDAKEGKREVYEVFAQRNIINALWEDGLKKNEFRFGVVKKIHF